MSDELKPKSCPWCGSKTIMLSPYTEVITKHTFAKCENCDIRWMLIGQWNTRPIEDKLRAELAEARRRIEELEAAVSSAEQTEYLREVGND